MRVGLSALTVAEYFREDLQQDVLLFIDNIFRVDKVMHERNATMSLVLPLGLQCSILCCGRGTIYIPSSVSSTPSWVLRY